MQTQLMFCSSILAEFPAVVIQDQDSQKIVKKKTRYPLATVEKIRKIVEAKYSDCVYKNPLSRGRPSIFEEVRKDLINEHKIEISVKNLRFLWITRVCPYAMQDLPINKTNQIKLAKIYHEHEKKWADIARIFFSEYSDGIHYYSENAIKNLFYRVNPETILSSQKEISSRFFDGGCVLAQQHSRKKRASSSSTGTDENSIVLRPLKSLKTPSDQEPADEFLSSIKDATSNLRSIDLLEITNFEPLFDSTSDEYLDNHFEKSSSSILDGDVGITSPSAIAEWIASLGGESSDLLSLVGSS